MITDTVWKILQDHPAWQLVISPVANSHWFVVRLLVCGNASDPVVVKPPPGEYPSDDVIERAVVALTKRTEADPSIWERRSVTFDAIWNGLESVGLAGGQDDG